MKQIVEFVKKNRKLYFALVQNDFRSRYNGSIFGIFWGFVQPLVTVLVYWFVFQVGLRSSVRPDGTPFILWMICGIVPWFYFSEALGAATSSFIQYGYLVKKVQFYVAMIPMIKIGSSMIVHSIFVAFTMIIVLCSGYHISWSYFQILYYMCATTFLLVGISLVFSSVTVFFRDMSQIVGIMTQVGFWAIPIVWGSEVLPPRVRVLFQLNPVCYIVEGYRDCLLTNTPFWEHPYQSLYFWGFSLLMLYAGLRTFRKLKPGFADVL